MRLLTPLLFALLACAAWARESTPAPDPAALYTARCAICHAKPETHAPALESLQRMPLSRILAAMEFGKMQAQAAMLEQHERVAVGQWLAQADDAERDNWIAARACPAPLAEVPVDGTANWGFGPRNARHLSEGVEISPANAGELRLAWSLAFPQVTDMRSQPVAAGEALFVGTQNGNLLALDAASGCVYWHLALPGAIRSGLALAAGADGAPTLFLADDLATVYAVDALRGTLRWKQSVRLFPTSVVSGSPAVHGDRVYVPLSSFEVAVAGLPTHACCRSHGAVLALDAANGRIVWTHHTTAQAVPTGKNAAGVQSWGPSGASVWSTPTFDAKRGVLYVGTGENFSHPATDTSDAVLALDLATGTRRWSWQALAGDVWNAACQLDGPNCPQDPGPDWDIGASVALVTGPDGRDRLLVGQKSGEAFALDPDAAGKLLWRARIGQGTANGGNSGIHWGMASDGSTLYAPISDPDWKLPGYTPRPGVFAVRVADGTPVWQHVVERGCAVDPLDVPAAGLAQMRQAGAPPRDPWPACPYFYAHSAAAVLANGVVYAGALDGKVRLLDARDGRELHRIETRIPLRADNGIDGHGGSIDVGGVVPHGRFLFVTSGYSMFGQMPGNLLLAYALPLPPHDERRPR